MPRNPATAPTRRSQLLLLLCAACQAGGVAEKMRPKDPSAADALGSGECKGVTAGAEPLVVDWMPEQRGDLEVAMRDGVAVVAYSCDSLRLLTDCKIPGDYGFIGMTRKEQVVRLQNADEARLNLPLSQGKIGGELSRGSSLDVAMIMVGKKRTTWQEPTRADLQGSCGEATHYVRGATVGAFVVELGTAAKAKAAAEMFGIGASAGTESNKQSRNQDGDPKDCAAASPDASNPPAQCGAPIRLVLAPIGDASKGEPAKGEPHQGTTRAAMAAAERACPDGSVFADGKCTAAQAERAHQCRPEDARECEEQCDRGHAGSCGALGLLHATGNGVAIDTARAATLLRKACDGGEAAACVNLGLLVEAGDGVTQDQGAAADLFEQGCAAGVALGCERLGRVVLGGVGGRKSDAAKALALFRQGCEGGQDTSCAAAAELLAESKAGDDRRLALELHERACSGSVGSSCVAAGRLHESKGSGAGSVFAEQHFRRACILDQGEGCFDLGRLELARDEDAAKRSFEAACVRRSTLGCAALVVGFGDKRAVAADVKQKQALQNKCSKGDARSCGKVGLLDAAMGMPNAKGNLDRACRDSDAFSCAMAKHVK